MPHLLPPSGPPQKLRSVDPQQFECELEHSGRSAVWLRLHGELDIASAQVFSEAVERALASALLVMVDMRDLAFVDSAGIHELIKADARARRSGRRLAVIRGSGQVDRVAELIGLADSLDVVELKPVLVTGRPRPATAE